MPRAQIKHVRRSKFGSGLRLCIDRGAGDEWLTLGGALPPGFQPGCVAEITLTTNAHGAEEIATMTLAHDTHAAAARPPPPPPPARAPARGSTVPDDLLRVFHAVASASIERGCSPEELEKAAKAAAMAARGALRVLTAAPLDSIRTTLEDPNNGSGDEK